MNATVGIQPKRKGFMAEGKPGHPGALDLRLRNHEQLQITMLTEENLRLRSELEQRDIRIAEATSALKKIMEGLA